MKEKQIRVKAMCLLEHDGRVLVADAETLKSTRENRETIPGVFYRVLGGGMNFSESAEECVRREIREELDSEIDNLKFLDVIENRFKYGGEHGHEIVFLFSGTLTEKNLLEQEAIHILDDGYEFDAVWVSKEKLTSGEKPLYPKTNYDRFI